VLLTGFILRKDAFLKSIKENPSHGIALNEAVNFVNIIPLSAYKSQ